MKLDYNPKTKAFILRVPRKNKELVKAAIDEHGLDFSIPDSTEREAVLFTREQYAAVDGVATSRAMNEVGWFVQQVQASLAQESNRNFAAPDGQELWPFQRAGVEYVLDRINGGGSALIGDQPGLGKTAQAIVTANEIQAERVLVVCPANIRIQWAKQIRAWTTMSGRPIIYPILKSADGVHPRANWTVISYNLLNSPAIFECLMNTHYDLIIMDEAHFLKTPSTKRTQAVFGGQEDGLETRTEAMLALTGTPLPNRPKECYTLARGLCWDSIEWMSEGQFTDRFNPQAVIERGQPDENGRRKKIKIEKMGRLPELQARLRSSFMVRRRKRDVLTQLPDVRHDIIHIDPDSTAIRKALEAESMLEIDPNDLSGINAEAMGHISVVRREMGMAKVKECADYIAQVIDGGEQKVVVFGWHIHVLNALEDRLGKYGLVRVDGRTSPARRQIAVDRFQKDDSITVFLGNLQSIGVGVDGLQNVCSRAIFVECSWTPSDNEQGISRLERIGQSTGILAEFLVVPGSFDERVLGTSLEKLQNIHKSMDKQGVY